MPLQFPILKENINNWSTVDVVLLPKPRLATSAGRCSRSKKLKKIPQGRSLNAALPTQAEDLTAMQSVNMSPAKYAEVPASELPVKKIRNK